MLLNDEFMAKIRPVINENQLRFGDAQDGGYVVDLQSVVDAKLLISLGYGFNCSFEKDFIKFDKNKSAILFDDQINLFTTLKTFFSTKFRLNRKYVDTLLFRFANLARYISMKLSRRITYHNLRVVKEATTSKEIAFSRIIDGIEVEYFLKIDIEGYEYEILELDLNLLKKCLGICIEFHQIDGNNKEKFLFIVEKLKREFDVTNIHINNYGGIKNGIPEVIEVTFQRKIGRNIGERNYVKTIPNSNLNYKNNPKSPEIYYIYD